jgi:hypothetical protein
MDAERTDDAAGVGALIGLVTGTAVILDLIDAHGPVRSVQR